VCRTTHLPLRILEIGTAAGLNLRWDQYHYQSDGDGWGNAHAEVQLRGYTSAVPVFAVDAHVLERRGCDRSPIDPCSEEGRLTLRSYIWADQIERLRLLDSALAVAQRIPVVTEQANAADWVEPNLTRTVPGCATVLFHSIVWQYLAPGERHRIAVALERAGRSSSHEAPLAWLRMEPNESGSPEVRVRIWPDGTDRLLASCGFHGPPVHWSGRSAGHLSG
jgi:hypothetical protein